ncbi:MAG: hypothetical protein ACOYYS_19765 [Chloroflexota bacterium]
MATTIPGGAYLSSDGKTWHDANGNPIRPPVALADDPLDAETPGELRPVGDETPATQKPAKSK